jgi:hypothetical protein
VKGGVASKSGWSKGCFFASAAGRCALPKGFLMFVLGLPETATCFAARAGFAVERSFT